MTVTKSVGRVKSGFTVGNKYGRASGMRAVKSGFFSSDLQRKRRLNQLAREEAMASQLRDDGFEVFSPTVVCDRIAIKDGKVYFIEFKKTGQCLREAQQLVCNLVPAMYLIRYEKAG